MRKWLVASGILLSFGLGCASPSQKSVTTPVTSSRALLFPLGVYHHEVKVEIRVAPDVNGAAGAPPKSMSFRGLVQIHADAIRIAVLSPFNTTILKLTEDRKTGEIKTESYSESFRKLEPKVREYYQLLRQLLTLPLPVPKPALLAANSDGLPLQVHEGTGATESDFRFSGYDAHGMPARIEIESPRFLVEVKVTGYEL